MSKVLIISNSDWNLVNFRLPLINELILNGQRVICVSGKSGKINQHEFNHNIDWIYLNSIHPRGVNPVSDVKLCYEIITILKSTNPDIVICYTLKINCYTGILCNFLKVPYIINVTGLGSEFKETRGYSLLVKFLLRISLINSSWTIFHNYDDRLRLIADGLLRDDQAKVISGSGVDVHHFTTKSQIRSIRKFIFIGRLLKEKGIVLFIKAALKLSIVHKSLKFYIIGDQYNVQNEEVENAIAMAKLNASFVFGDFTKDVRHMLENIDCFVLPSEREGLSKGLMEAMSMQKFVIVSNVPGCKDLVSDGFNGFLMKEYSVEALVQSIEEAIELNEFEIERFTTHARNTIVNNYTTDIIVKQYMELISPVLNK